MTGPRKKGKKNRKHGRGVRKVERSRFKSYANLFAHVQEKKRKRMEARARRFARLKNKRAERKANANIQAV